MGPVTNSGVDVFLEALGGIEEPAAGPGSRNKWCDGGQNTADCQQEAWQT